jgi:hypothetical protein
MLQQAFGMGVVMGFRSRQLLDEPDMAVQRGELILPEISGRDPRQFFNAIDGGNPWCQ